MAAVKNGKADYIFLAQRQSLDIVERGRVLSRLVGWLLFQVSDLPPCTVAVNNAQTTMNSRVECIFFRLDSSQTESVYLFNSLAERKSMAFDMSMRTKSLIVGFY